jgi:hypothetical protein
MKKLLVFEDDPTVSGMYESALKGKLDVIRVLNLDGAKQHLVDPDQVAAIIMGGNQQRSPLSSARTVIELRRSFAGPIIATSGYPSVQAELMACGCSHDAPKPASLPAILKILGFPLTHVPS